MFRHATLLLTAATVPAGLFAQQAQVDQPAAGAIEAPAAELPANLRERLLAEPPIRPLTVDLPADALANVSEFDAGTLTTQELEFAEAWFQIQYEGIRPGPDRLGVVRPLDSGPVFGALDLAQVNGDGSTGVRVLKLRAGCAFGMRVHFRDVDLKGGSLLVYAGDAENHVVRGPFYAAGPTHSGEFWTGSLPGESVVIEYEGDETPEFEIDSIVYFDRDPAGSGGAEALGLRSCGDAPASALLCNVDVNCASPAPTSTARRATGQMNYIEDGVCDIRCTGTLLADLDSDTFVPYFLTANHCIDDQTTFDTLEVVWDWETSMCNGTLPNWFTLPRMFGERLITTSGATVGNDATFGRLIGSLHPNVAFAGWTTNEEVGQVGVHHPRGDFKRSVRSNYVSLSTDCGLDCGCFTPANYAFYELETGSDDGIIEPGSSGSGMFSSGGALVGQLYGTCSLCPDAFDCFHAGDWCSMYGEWQQTFNDVAHWLQRGGTVHVDDSNVVGPFQGTPNFPYRTVLSGYNFAVNVVDYPGTRLMVYAGNYPETLTLSQPVILVGNGGTARIGDVP